MPTDHTEKAFEAAIEDHLLTSGGYLKADPANFDRQRALDPTVLIPFIQETQPEKWEGLQKIHGADTESVLLDDLSKAMDSQGSLNVIRHGFKCFGKTFHVAFFAPAHGMNPDTQKLYAANRLTVTRQLHYSTAHENSLDLVLSINGIPVATAELKNPMTGQNVEHAKHQYMNDRDHREKVFEFKKRTLVHFAVDPDLVYMATRLAGKSTYFLPFNLGDGAGAGNPENPNGYRTAYLWEHVWARDSFLDILARFLHLETVTKKVGGKTVKRETMIFPRFHQLDVVRKLERDARCAGPGTNYLVQHSAGSGKSNSIAWLAHRLASLHNQQDEKVFHSVVVITDRVVLDKQLQDTIYQFEHKQGVVEKIDVDSSQLAGALKGGTPIIITTLQKFPFVTEKVGDLPDRSYAVIVDEAHSSQSGETATELKGVLAGSRIRREASERAEAEGLLDHEEEILRTMAKRGKQPNLSFFAFTATPKYRTLEVFGSPGPDGKPIPFHLYSMRQAIEEGFILDVLEHYTTYKAYYGLIKSIEDDPQVERKKAAKALARFMSLHPHNIAQKTEVMVEHFRASTRHKIGGRAKAMVVTGSRLHAVRYKQAFDKYIAGNGYTDVKALVAFSGEVEDPDVPGVKYTEVGMNEGIRQKELPERFGSDEYQVLLVAEKYQTGFDQPLLHTMYVDKRLSGVQAVQTLSRLNRTCPGKKDTFVLDFVNEREEIFQSFQPYYEQPAVGEQADPRQLYDLQAKLIEEHVFYQQEVDQFCQVFFRAKAKHSKAEHAQMNACIDPAVTRFRDLRDELKPELSEKEWLAAKEEAQEKFRGLLATFRNLYSFLSQIIPYQDSDLEKLYAYTRFLLSKLPRRSLGPQYHFDDEVALKYYRLEKISDGAIELEPGKPGIIDGPTAVGTGKSQDEQIELSQLIDLLNQRFGTDFKLADQLFLDQIREEATADDTLRQAAAANTVENFKYVFGRALEDLFIDRMEQNEDIFARFMNDPEFQAVVESRLRQQVYEQIREEMASEASGGAA